VQCFQTLTGSKFIVTATPGTTDLDKLLHEIYELYSDYVLKNPFYELDMPIRYAQCYSCLSYSSLRRTQEEVTDTTSTTSIYSYIFHTQV
jgi:Sybindin-like family